MFETSIPGALAERTLQLFAGQTLQLTEPIKKIFAIRQNVPLPTVEVLPPGTQFTVFAVGEHITTHLFRCPTVIINVTNLNGSDQAENFFCRVPAGQIHLGNCKEVDGHDPLN